MSDTVSVPRVQTDDKDTNQLQQNIITAISALQNQITAVSSLNYLVQTSSVKTGITSNDWLLMTNNSIVLTDGKWMLFGQGLFSNNGAGPAYTETDIKWCVSNGADTNVEPTAIVTIGGITNRFRFNLGSTGGTFSETQMNAASVLTAGNQTVYLVPNVSAGTMGNTRVSVYLIAVKIA